MDPEKKSLNFIFPTKYGIPKSLKFSHWPSKYSAKNVSDFPLKLTVGFTLIWKKSQIGTISKFAGVTKMLETTI